MTNRKRVYLPPAMQQQLNELRSTPGYEEESDGTLLAILADRLSRGVAVTASAPETTADAPKPGSPLGDICLDF